MDEIIDREITPSQVGYDERDANYYFEKFDLGKGGGLLRGKKVLDIGAGQSDFSSTINSQFGEGTVIRIDASYQDKKPTSKVGAITGVSQNIPFPDNQFDEVLLSWSAPYWTRNPREVIKEAIRVAKPGGNVRIRPAEIIKGKYLVNPLKPTKLTRLNPHQEEEGREYYYTVIITKPNTIQEEDKEIETLLKLLDFSPGNKYIK